MKANLRKAPPSPEQFMDDLFDCDAAFNGEMVQLSQLDMEQFVGRDHFIAEIKTRRFTAVENRDQIYVLCNSQDLRLMA